MQAKRLRQIDDKAQIAGHTAPPLPNGGLVVDHVHYSLHLHLDCVIVLVFVVVVAIHGIQVYRIAL